MYTTVNDDDVIMVEIVVIVVVDNQDDIDYFDDNIVDQDLIIHNCCNIDIY